MRVAKRLIALLVGLGVTFLQLVAVGVLNDSSVIAAEEVLSQKIPQPVIVAKPPMKPKAPQRSQDTLRTRAPQQVAAAAQVRTTALPALTGEPANLGLLNVLPGLGEVGLGQVEMPPEPDRPARERRTVQPVYPVTAQRDGIEGYVS